MANLWRSYRWNKNTVGRPTGKVESMAYNAPATVKWLSIGWIEPVKPDRPAAPTQKTIAAAPVDRALKSRAVEKK